MSPNSATSPPSWPGYPFSKREAAHGPAPRESIAPTPNAAVWCVQRGTQLSVGGRFCASCGKQASPAVPAGPAERGVGSMLPPQPPGDAQAAAAGNRFSDWAIVMGAIAFLVFPIILGPGAIILASIALTKSPRTL